ncbi:hypothetical protein D3C72_2192700 [compost metagenome]
MAVDVNPAALLPAGAVHAAAPGYPQLGLDKVEVAELYMYGLSDAVSFTAVFLLLRINSASSCP